MSGEVKAEAKVEHITIKVRGPDGNEVEFKIKNTTSMGKVHDAYAAKQGVNKASVRFNYEGNRIRETDTPASLGLEDGDVIDATTEQIGGFRV
ncbi:Small ubiquitin- modifier 1 [Podochytrium sp. JEL0797]|nr:Small ubiquitin- modifier 1 [Podochytrium sp. JEL0797]